MRFFVHQNVNLKVNVELNLIKTHLAPHKDAAALSETFAYPKRLRTTLCLIIESLLYLYYYLLLFRGHE